MTASPAATATAAAPSGWPRASGWRPSGRISAREPGRSVDNKERFPTGNRSFSHSDTTRSDAPPRNAPNCDPHSKKPRKPRVFGTFPLAQWEGFEPYESRKRRVLTYPQMLCFQGFSPKLLIPMGFHLWSNLWSKWGATRRCEAPKGGSK